MSEIVLRHKDVWIGGYRGVSFEIVRWNRNEDQMRTLGHESFWNYYIIIPEPMVEEEDRPQVFLDLGEADKYGFRHYDYMRGPLSDIYWHGGITFYERHLTQGVSPAFVKAGCDYQHLWDEGMRYNEDIVLVDVKHTIDDLHEALSLKSRDPKTGEWISPQTTENQS